MVSMKDISAACGVSVATVSKALNDHKDIGAETKAHIRQAAKEMGYFPNSAAKALKTRRSYNIGVLFAVDDQSGLTHDYFAYVLDSLKRTVEARGYDITFINDSSVRPNKMSYLEHCRYRGFDGVVIANTRFSRPEVMELAQSDIPSVTIDHLFNNVSAVLSDNVKGMRDLLHYIYEKGHRRIAYIHGADSSVTKSRLASFYKTAEELGIEVPDEYIRKAAYRDTNAAHIETERLLDLKGRPTCILYPDDFACFGGINAIKERGLRIPGDISVAGYDGIRIGRHIEPKLTTVKQDTARLGQFAAEKLLSLIEQPKTTIIEQIIVEGEVYPGGSVGDLSKL
ncbi:MAG: LacI family transcriptional regulator [Roseburia sp.]|nr:LacI family transcriptional regulator [Roseburia sp.]MCM1201628.1 LacI family transcriptional regulator [Bacteroides fragilis]